MPFIPHTADETAEMLECIQAPDTETLFDEIPEALKGTLEKIPEGINEMEMLKLAEAIAAKDKNGLCFIGAGSYEHHIPAAVWDIASRGEFLTAYTPYQAEASQGTLQLLYEFQTMIAELTGMEVANASLYDGASALAEAVLMAVRINKVSKTNRILVVGTIHPLYRETLNTIVRNQHIEIVTLPFDKERGVTAFEALKQHEGDDITALVMAQPNFFGCLEDVDQMTNWANEKNAIAIACVNPISLGLLKPPGQWGKYGVDIVCGEGQPLGAPLASGGPYFGFFSTRLKYVRQVPGRLVGRTEDQEGRVGYTLTLQAREQHIRRAKATSNICTNQGLLVTAATIHMSLLGPEGLASVALRCYNHTALLLERLVCIEGIERVFKSPFFHEVLIRFEQPVDTVLQALACRGILGGYALQTHYPEFENALLICATEMRTEEEIDKYVDALVEIMKKRDA